MSLMQVDIAVYWKIVLEHGHVIYNGDNKDVLYFIAIFSAPHSYMTEQFQTLD